MREITYARAINEAIAEEMRRDDSVIVMGEDIGAYGGSFKVTVGLFDEFGPERVRDTPISESAIVGCGLGAALTGLRPVVEIMFCDFTTVAMDQIINQVAKIRYMSGGAVAVPLVIRTNIGAGRSSAAQHSQSLQGWFMHTPGLKVAIPSTAHDAKGLLKTAIRMDDPVMFMEPKMLYNQTGPVPEGEYTVPFGEAEVRREGTDVTVVATSRMVVRALNVAQELEHEGISLEVVDPRTLVPLDTDTILTSVCKTSRAVVADEGYPVAGVAAELAALISHDAFDFLDAPVERVTAKGVPIPFSPPLEHYVMPEEEDLLAAVKVVLGT